MATRVPIPSWSSLTTGEPIDYDIGNGFGHLALGVDDIYKTCAQLRSRGAKVVREPGPMAHGGAHIAFIEDPNGYKIELVDLSRHASAAS